MKQNVIILASVITFSLIITSMNFKRNITSVLLKTITVNQNITTRVSNIKLYNKTKNKTILYWDTFFEETDMGFGLGFKPFENCPVKSCYTTNDKTFMPIEEFDALIFHGARYKIDLNGKPNKRRPHQKYIFYSLESYFNTHFETKLNRNFYNWSMSYKRNSDIYAPYGMIREQSINYTFPTATNLKKRAKKVAWFASNCFTEESKIRSRYVKELQKYIPVDVYGSCGKLRCLNHERCYKMLEQNYKFYLAFENSLCEDYVTEKLFNVLQYNIIPVVLGFGDYSVVAPPHSVIDTRHFVSPKDLAQYLWSLDQNETEYLKYFEWKNNYTVDLNIKPYVMCQLCQKLHQALNYSYYEDIQDWYKGYWCFS